MATELKYPYTFAQDGVELVTLHRPEPALWILELKNGADSRFTGVMCQKAVAPALDLIEKEWRALWKTAQVAKDKTKGAGSGALIISGNMSQQKFFSNGFDFQEVLRTPAFGFVFNYFVPIMNRLLTFPIPTIAAINGHCFASGFMFALCCDYRVMTSGKAWACFNEVHFGSPLPHSFAPVLEAKARTPTLIRSLALEGHRFTPSELVETGLVDKLADGGTEGVIKEATALAKTVAVNASMGVWGVIKKELYYDVLQRVNEDLRQITPQEENLMALAKL